MLVFNVTFALRLIQKITKKIHFICHWLLNNYFYPLVLNEKIVGRQIKVQKKFRKKNLRLVRSILSQTIKHKSFYMLKKSGKGYDFIVCHNRANSQSNSPHLLAIERERAWRFRRPRDCFSLPYIAANPSPRIQRRAWVRHPCERCRGESRC